MVRAPGSNVTLDASKRQGPLLHHHITFADRDNRQPSLMEGVGTSSPQASTQDCSGSWSLTRDLDVWCIYIRYLGTYYLELILQTNGAGVRSV